MCVSREDEGRWLEYISDKTNAMNEDAPLRRCHDPEAWANQELIDAFGKGVVDNWNSKKGIFTTYFTSFSKKDSKDAVSRQADAFRTKVMKSSRWKDSGSCCAMSAFNPDGTHWIAVILNVSAYLVRCCQI